MENPDATTGGHADADDDVVRERQVPGVGHWNPDADAHDEPAEQDEVVEASASRPVMRSVTRS